MQILFRTLVLLGCSIILYSGSVWAKKIRAVTFPIPLLVEANGTGLFVDVINDIAKRGKVSLDVQVLPPAKALLAFSNGEKDIMFPGLEFHLPKNFLRSKPFYYKVDYVFSKEGANLTSIKDLEGKKVGLTFRYHYAKEIVENKKIKLEFAQDDIENMKKLGQGKIDAFVVEERSGLQALALSGAQKISYKKDAPVTKQAVFFAFQNTAEGKDLADIFSRQIDAMKKDGSLKKILLLMGSQR